MTRKILPSKRVALLVDAGPAVPLENRLATSVVSVNAKEGKTQKENHRLENFQELVVVEIVFVKPGQTYQYTPMEEGIHSEQRTRTTGNKRRTWVDDDDGLSFTSTAALALCSSREAAYVS